ncbi:MAG: hypothetical protein ABR540_02980 [Acidimicrobiales bacterium]
MAPDTPEPDPPAEAELADNQAVKDEAVLGREGVEQDLMQKDESPEGEEIEDVEDVEDE